MTTKTKIKIELKNGILGVASGTYKHLRITKKGVIYWVDNPPKIKKTK